MGTEQVQEFFDEVVAHAKANVLLFAGPLALLLAQLRTIFLIDSVLLKLLVTSAVGFLLVGLCLTYYLKEFVTFVKMQVMYQDAEQKDKRVGLYVSWVEEIYENAGSQLSVERGMEIARNSWKAILVCIVGGYLSLAVCLLLVVWI